MILPSKAEGSGLIGQVAALFWNAVVCFWCLKLRVIAGGARIAQLYGQRFCHKPPNFFTGLRFVVSCGDLWGLGHVEEMSVKETIRFWFDSFLCACICCAS